MSKGTTNSSTNVAYSSYPKLCWNAIMSMAAIAQFYSFVVQHTSQVENSNNQSNIGDIQDQKSESSGESFDVFEMISLIFNLIWILDSLKSGFTAGSNKVVKEEQKDIEKILRIEAKEKQQQQQSKKEEKENIKEMKIKERRARELNTSTYYKVTFLVAFLIAIFIRLSLLPVNFYVWLFPSLSNIIQNVNEQFMKNTDLLVETVSKTASKKKRHSTAILEARTMIEDPSTIQYCMAYFIFFRLNGVFMFYLNLWVKKICKRIALRIAKLAFLHPKRFQKQIAVILQWIRWIKYFAPFVGALNKFKGNFGDLKKKYRQYMEARKARKIREMLRRKMTEEERLENAAIRIQSIFRANKVKKLTKYLKFMTSRLDTASMYALKIQLRMRARIAKKKVLLKKQKKTLKELENRKGNLDTDEKIELYKLRKDIQKKEKKQNEIKMLLRPNTRFAVTWKTMFVFTILIEVLVLVLSLNMNSSGDKSKKKKSLDEVLEAYLLPECPAPASSSDKKRKSTLIVVNVIHSIQKLLSSLIHRRSNNMNNNTATGVDVQQQQERGLTTSIIMPYLGVNTCNDFTSWQESYVKLILLCTRNFSLFVSFIMFLDVFVTFFTGEINPVNGVLEPKPFFTRWILPGMFLQLLVNPQMSNTFAKVKKGFKFSHEIGPANVLRCAIAMTPLSHLLLKILVRTEMNLVSSGNNKLYLRA